MLPISWSMAILLPVWRMISVQAFLARVMALGVPVLLVHQVGWILASLGMGAPLLRTKR